MIDAIIKAMTKNALILALFALLATSLIGATYWLTQDTINQQAKIQLSKRLDQVIAPQSHDNDLIKSCQYISDPALGPNPPHLLFLAKKEGKLMGAAIEAIAPDGYSGNINILIGFNENAAISGVRILRHNETPGLGDKISKRVSNWVDAFVGKKPTSNQDPRWSVKKDGGDFDQFTGATITPRAVVKAIKKASVYYQAHYAEFLSLNHPCGDL